MKTAYKRIVGRSTVIIRKTAAAAVYVFLVISVGQVMIYKFIDPPFTNHMAFKLLMHKTGRGYYYIPVYEWRDFEEMSDPIKKAVLASEDQRFFSHCGFDFIELKKAYRSYMENNYLRGASTISMQTARSVFLWPERSWIRKALEAYYTILIELSWGKNRILEMYLNMVDWGPGIVGVEAASQKYFHTTAMNLNEEKASLLASVLPRPHKWSPVEPDDHVILRQKRIMKAMALMPAFESKRQNSDNPGGF